MGQGQRILLLMVKAVARASHSHLFPLSHRDSAHAIDGCLHRCWISLQEKNTARESITLIMISNKLFVCGETLLYLSRSFTTNTTLRNVLGKEQSGPFILDKL